MKAVLTKKGVEIDICSSCGGVWLDKGELYFFIRATFLQKYQIHGLQNSRLSSHVCPKCHSKMKEGQIPGFPYWVEECSACHGIYFDAQEFEKIQKSKLFKNIQKDSFKKVYPFRIPSLALTTGIVCFSLYGLLFAVIVFLMETMTLPVWAGSALLLCFVLLQFYFAPIFLDWQLRFFGSLDWVPLEKLPSHFKNSLIRLCQQNRIPLPKVGLVRDGSPAAYTYGRTPYSARVVFSKGMFQILDQDELETVLAHELGHIKHWDFVLMTIMKVVPIFLYNIYSMLKKLLRGKKKQKGGRAIIIGLIVSYIAYLISEYLVLFVSRVREYHADKFSCFSTKKPNKLITALVKISYGLLKFKPSSDEKDSYEDKKRSVESLNIMNISHSRSLALIDKDSGSNSESIKNIMRWDLWNPWAFYYELYSTHPLTAKRINAISSYAIHLKQKPYLIFDKKKPESYMDDFLWDLFILALPLLGGVLGPLLYIFINNYQWGQITGDSRLLLPLILISIFFFSLGCLIRTMKAYPGRENFFSCSIASLLKVIKVSPVRSYPVILKGRILGRGEAGFIFSEDFFLKDETGMMFLNHEPFGPNFLFALFRFKKFLGQEVTVRGWYRRAPSPYLEVRDIQSQSDRSQAYTYHYKMIFSILGLIISLICFLNVL